MDQPARTVHFGIKDKQGRECGARYVINMDSEFGWVLRFSMTRDGEDYKAVQGFSSMPESFEEFVARVDAMIEAERKRCEKQFAVKAIAA